MGWMGLMGDLKAVAILVIAGTVCCSLRMGGDPTRTASVPDPRKRGIEGTLVVVREKGRGIRATRRPSTPPSAPKICSHSLLKTSDNNVIFCSADEILQNKDSDVRRLEHCLRCLGRKYNSC